MREVASLTRPLATFPTRVMSMLPSSRDAVWLGAGIAIGAAAAKALSSAKTTTCTLQPPKRVFKLCVKSELDAFQKLGKVESSLDRTDGFIHLSDRTSPPKVADLFFNGAKDLYILELDATRLEGLTQWVVGVMGEGAPSKEKLETADTTVHYLIADGCVHVYGAPGVGMHLVTQMEHVPLGSDGKHVFPVWL